MVIQKTINNLKDKPKDERKAVAGGIAIAVVAILFIGWTFFFFKSIQRGTQLQQLDGGAASEFYSTTVQEAQQQLMEGFSDFDELRALREQYGNQSEPASVQQEAYQYSETDQFGRPNASD